MRASALGVGLGALLLGFAACSDDQGGGPTTPARTMGVGSGPGGSDAPSLDQGVPSQSGNGGALPESTASAAPAETEQAVPPVNAPVASSSEAMGETPPPAGLLPDEPPTDAPVVPVDSGPVSQEPVVTQPEPSAPEPTMDPGLAEPEPEPQPDVQEPEPAEPEGEPLPDASPAALGVPYVLGVDISFIQEEEDKGIVFVDDGVQKDPVQLMKDHGFNFVRLRLFHDPGAPGGYQTEFVTRAEPYCDTPHTIEMAQRVKAAGMGLLLDFHYSDTWADPGDQHKPAAWSDLSFPDLVTALHDYTRDTLLEFDAAGALPDMVQVGNEITPGMLHPDGHTYEPNNWDQLAQLLTAGLSAVKEVDPDILTMLHIDRGGDNDTTVWWVGEAMNRGVQFDILGQSAYSAFHGGPADWDSNFRDMAARYPDLSFVIAEYNGDKRAANDLVRGLPDGRGLGTFFWEPTANGEWGDSMVSWSGNQAVADPAQFAIYDQIADEYGLR